MCDLNDNWSKSLENSLECLLGSLGTCPSSKGKIVNLSGPSLQIFGIVLPFPRETNWLKEIHNCFQTLRARGTCAVSQGPDSSQLHMARTAFQTCNQRLYVHSCQESPCCGNAVNSSWAMRRLGSQERAI